MGQCSFLNIDLKLTHTLRAITVATGGVWAGKQAIKLIVPAFEFGSKPVNLLHLILDRVLAAIQQLLRLHDIQSYHALAFGY